MGALARGLAPASYTTTWGTTGPDPGHHPDQLLEKQPDGSIIVRFRAGGQLEMCWHLYTWGANVEVIAPASLCKLMNSALKHRNFEVGEE